MSNDCTFSRLKVSPQVYMQMYSLTAVGGIQYTTEMANKQSISKMKKGKSGGQRSDLLRTHMSEQLMVGVAGGPGVDVFGLTTNASGIVNDQLFLCPFGLTAASLSTSAWSNGAANNVEKPHLRKLFNVASDFRQYRVLSGKLTFVPNIGANTAGLLTMSSSADPFDMVTATAVAYSSGPSYKTFQLSSNKEVSIPLSVDSSWKKNSAVLSCPMGSVFDGSGTATNVVVNVATLDDLCFSALGFNVQSATASTFVGTFRLDYEVEFRGLIDVASNA